MKKFIDDFSVLAVEARLVQELPALFSPTDIIDMDDTTVIALASESQDSSAERTLCEEKLAILEAGLRALENVQDSSSVPQGTALIRKPIKKVGFNNVQNMMTHR